MNITFPEPLIKKSICIEIPVEMWESIMLIKEEHGITDEQVFSTLISAAYVEYSKSLDTEKQTTDFIKEQKKPIVIIGTLDTQEASLVKNCLECNTKFKKRINETIIYFKSKRFCSTKCSAIYRAKNKTKFINPRTVEADRKMDERVRSVVISCANIDCEEKLVKGTGVVYKGLEYHSDTCLEAVINNPEAEE